MTSIERDILSKLDTDFYTAVEELELEDFIDDFSDPCDVNLCPDTTVCEVHLLHAVCVCKEGYEATDDGSCIISKYFVESLPTSIDVSTYMDEETLFAALEAALYDPILEGLNFIVELQSVDGFNFTTRTFEQAYDLCVLGRVITTESNLNGFNQIMDDNGREVFIDGELGFNGMLNECNFEYINQLDCGRDEEPVKCSDNCQVVCNEESPVCFGDPAWGVFPDENMCEPHCHCAPGLVRLMSSATADCVKPEDCPLDQSF